MPSNTRETATPAKPSVTAQTEQPTEEMIRIRAYQLYEQRGREEGHAHEDWLQAESEIISNPAEKMAA